MALLILGIGLQEKAAASCVQSSQSAWTNTVVTTETATFTADFDAMPSQANIDGVVGFSLNAVTGYNGLAVIVRFSTSGAIDVRNGASYAAERWVPYAAGASYHFRMVINPGTKTYSVYVTPAGGSEETLATHYAFRSQQANTTSLNNWAAYSDIGTVSVCNMTLTAISGSSVSNCLTSSNSAWTNRAVATQIGPFTATFDATPSQASMDGVVGFSLNAASGYNSLAAIVRFSTSGAIDVRNGASYAAERSVPYAAGASYHFRMVINPGTKTYSVYVTPAGGSEETLATNYAFRSQQANTTSLNNWATYSDIGTVSVCNMQENAVAGCVQSSQSAWTNTAVTTETAAFTATFDATPSQASMDGVVGFSLNAATGYNSLAAIVRFSTSGAIDVRNGASYAAERSVPYAAGASYHFRMVINPGTKTYSVYVTPAGGSEETLATHYAFRSQQANTTSLNNWATYAHIGTVSVCNMTVTTNSVGGGGNGSSSLSWTPSRLSFGSVALGASKTLAVTITATGKTNTTISNVTLAGAGFGASGVSSGLILSPGKSATLNVSFAPSGSGSIMGIALITSDASNSPLSISLSGSGVSSVSHSVQLTWQPSTSLVVGYNVYRGVVSGGPYTKLNSSDLLLMTYTDGSVASGQTYYYCVTAVNSAGQESAYSGQVWTTIP